MHTVELLEEVLELAGRLGYQIRQEWLAGRGSGICEVRGEPWLFVDLSESPRDQLANLLACLRGAPELGGASMSPYLRGILGVRKAA